MAVPVSPFQVFWFAAANGSGALIVTVTFSGVWSNGNPFTSARVQNTSSQTANALVRIPAGTLMSGTVAAGFDHTFTQAQLGGWSQGDGASVESVSWV